MVPQSEHVYLPQTVGNRVGQAGKNGALQTQDVLLGGSVAAIEQKNMLEEFQRLARPSELKSGLKKC